MPKKKQPVPAKEDILIDIDQYLDKFDFERIEGVLIPDKLLEALCYECEMSNWAGVRNVVADIRAHAEKQSPYIFATTGGDKKAL